jgi:hypothetical protein
MEKRRANQHDLFFMVPGAHDDPKIFKQLMEIQEDLRIEGAAMMREACAQWHETETIRRPKDKAFHRHCAAALRKRPLPLQEGFTIKTPDGGTWTCGPTGMPGKRDATPFG